MRHTYIYFWIILLMAGLACRQESTQDINTKTHVNAKGFFKWGPNRGPLISAHRGGAYPGFPENCLETFENTLSYTKALIECDISITKDRQLVLMHDDKVDRTTNGSGYVDELTLEALKKMKLKDNEGNVSGFRIPSLKEVLEWAKAAGAIVSLDVKRGVDFEKVIRLIEEIGAEGHVTIIVYNVANAAKVYQLNPSLMISVTIRNEDEFLRVKRAGIPTENLIAFTGVRPLDERHYKMLHDEGIFCILGTFGNLDRRALKRGGGVYRDLIKRGVDILATDRPVEAARAVGVLNKAAEGSLQNQTGD